tara:strand:+ start:234 stop:1229 length:996 start_codon:yes stop_codon:yes gene_type:complete
MEDGLQSKIDSLQVLRFFAAYSVMMVHLPIFQYGMWGVDIFFVISGFIMMYVTENSNKHFFIKRIFRIVPLYWLLTFFVFIIAILKPGLLNNTTANFDHLAKSLFFIPFNKNEIGHAPILFLGWTLNFEMIFYLLFALTLTFFNKKKFLSCSLIIVIFFFFNKFFSEKNFIFSTYANDILFEFIFGMIAFLIWKKYKDFNYGNNFFNHVKILSLLILITFVSNLANLPRSINYGIPSFILVLYFVIFLNNFKFPKIFVTLGDASYCIYLIHPYIVQFFYKILMIGSYNFPVQIIFTIIISFVVFAISILIFKFIELPINRYLKLKFLKNEI